MEVETDSVLENEFIKVVVGKESGLVDELCFKESGECFELNSKLVRFVGKNS